MLTTGKEGGGSAQNSGEAAAAQSKVDVSDAKAALETLYGVRDGLQGKPGSGGLCRCLGSVDPVSADGLEAALEEAVASGDIARQQQLLTRP